MPNALAIFQGPHNLSARERTISVIAGLGLAAAAAKPRPNPILNIAALLGGAYLAIRGATGRCPIKQALLSGPAEVAPVTVRTPAKRSRAAGR
ncbi:MAG TPA: YgaP-like transmembrane domain [Xanthobacteraceae bacterium]|nr:YgaP-like transmembrane domain [Xanthobacteraceae bacterium]